jgi:hypothetical protein
MLSQEKYNSCQEKHNSCHRKNIIVFREKKIVVRKNNLMSGKINVVRKNKCCQEKLSNVVRVVRKTYLYLVVASLPSSLFDLPPYHPAMQAVQLDATL